MADIRTGNFSDISGEVNIAAGNIIKHIQTIYERALTPGEVVEKDLEIEVNQLASGVRGYLERLQQQVVATDTPAPYKRLDSYALSDAQIFSGRDQDIQALENAIKRSPLTILQAESGAGKTSLLKAGLIPRVIARGDLAIWVRAEFANPARKIKEGLIENLELTPKLANTRLVGFLRRVSKIIGHDTTLILILDQFEEFFSKLTSDQDRKDFIEDLATCLNDATLNVRWVISITTDSFGQLGKFEPKIQNPFSNQQSLYLFNRQQAIEVITKPAASHGLEFEAGLLDRLLDDLLHDQKDKVAPTQIQLVCDALCNDLKKNDRLITQAMYDSKGGAEGILHDYIGNVMQTHIPPEERSAAYKILEALVTSEKKRIIRSKTDLTAALEHRGVSHELTESTLNHLLNQRLLRQFGDGGERAQYELVHDYLLKEIEIDEELVKTKQIEELIEDGVKAWKRNRNLLLGNDQVTLLENEKSLKLTDDAIELLALSAAANNKNPAHWIKALPPDKTQQLILQVVSGFRLQDATARKRSKQIAWRLREHLPKNIYIKLYFERIFGKIWVLALILPVVWLLYTPVNSWLNTPEMPNWEAISAIPGAKASQYIAMNLKNPDDVYVSDHTPSVLYLSEDGGNRWKKIVLNSIKSEIVGLSVIENNLYALTNKNVWVSRDGGSNWEVAENLPLDNGTKLLSISVNPNDGKNVYVGANNGRVYHSTNNGKTWDIVQPGYSGMSIHSISTNGFVIILATEDGVWVNSIANNTWSNISLTGCSKQSKEVNALALTYPYGTPPADKSFGFFAAIPKVGICDSDTKGLYGSTVLPLSDYPYTDISSMVTTGQANLGYQGYITTDKGILRKRIWFSNDIEWWKTKLERLLN